MKKKVSGFEKFMGKELTGAKKKEAIKQEKRKFKADKREQGRIARERKYLEQTGQLPDEIKRSKFQKSTADTQYSKPLPLQNQAANMPLNKYVAHAGICGRREAAELIKKAEILVNGKPVTEPGYKVAATDEIKYKGKVIYALNNPVYILLNKPKDYLTTVDDPRGRKTVIELIKHATNQRVYPVGRLDRNTTGVLLLTNDGELAQKLTHPSFQIKKIYEVGLDKPFIKKDFEKMINGVTLEDGFIQPDAISYADADDKSVVGIEIHSGKNRIVRRMFEHFGYRVIKLDRVLFGNLTKKNVQRGKWRLLAEKEVRLLKFMNNSFVKKQVTKEEKPIPEKPRVRSSPKKI